MRDDDFDSADDITVDGIIHRVACVHDGDVYLMGPMHVVSASRCKMLRKASESERLEQLKAVAGGTMPSKYAHSRRDCARDRLKALEPTSYDSGCC